MLLQIPLLSLFTTGSLFIFQELMITSEKLFDTTCLQLLILLWNCPHSSSCCCHKIAIDYSNKNDNTLLAFIHLIFYTNSQSHHSPSYKLHPTNIHDVRDPVVPLQQEMYTHGDVSQNSSCQALLIMKYKHKLQLIMSSLSSQLSKSQSEPSIQRKSPSFSSIRPPNQTRLSFCKVLMKLFSSLSWIEARSPPSTMQSFLQSSISVQFFSINLQQDCLKQAQFSKNK